MKTIAECLADELIKVAQGPPDQSTGHPSPEAASSKQTTIQEKNEFRSKTDAIYEMINPNFLNRRIKCSGIRPEGVLTVTNSLSIPRQIKVIT